jgi:hypothetical protein
MFGEHITLYLNPTAEGFYECYPATGVSLAKYVADHEAPERSLAPSFTGGARYEDASSYLFEIWASGKTYFPDCDAAVYFAAAHALGHVQTPRGAIRRIGGPWAS